GHLITFGILVGFGMHLDPMWEGHAFVTLSHMGDEPYELELGSCFVSLEIRVLSSPAVLPHQINPETL
ncbi:MAG: hypothetical protein U0984_09585, partial [Prosthecobacter sp.]|nr:hypothetical protein [Prosthecobacter sp.]